MCKTGSGAGKCAGAKSNTVRRRSNHARTDDQAGREKRANTDAAGGWRVHTAVDTPRRNAATRSKHLCAGADRCRAGSDTGSSYGVKTQQGRVRSSHGLTEAGGAGGCTRGHEADQARAPQLTPGKRSCRRGGNALHLAGAGSAWAFKQLNTNCSSPWYSVEEPRIAAECALRLGRAWACIPGEPAEGMALQEERCRRARRSEGLVLQSAAEQVG